jgi:hypothetical protein
MRRIFIFGRTILAAIFCSVIAASHAAAQSSPSPTPAKPGTFQLRAKAPEPGKWNVQRDGKSTSTIYDCKPLACADKVRVVLTASRSPTRNPDPQALEKLAKIDLPKAARAASAAREIMSDGAEKVETVVSETAQFHGYPSVVNETKYSRPNSTTYKGTVIIFAGPAMIRVEATSPDQALMKKSLADFIRVMEFEQGPPAPKKPAGTTL